MKMNTLEMLNYTFVAGVIVGVIYAYLVFRYVAKRRGVWDVLNKKEERKEEKNDAETSH
jgi:ABC-type Fe3+ transport system permease subunit